jgi:hypothetical protein
MLAIALDAPGIASGQSLFAAPPGQTKAAPADATANAAPAASPKKAAAVKPKPRKPTNPTQASKVNVINERKATLVELSLTSETTKDAKPQIVAHDLPGGKKISTPLAKKGGCIYSVSGTFDDQSTIELSALDLCKDDNLNLVE